MPLWLLSIQISDIYGSARSIRYCSYQLNHIFVDYYTLCANPSFSLNVVSIFPTPVLGIEFLLRPIISIFLASKLGELAHAMILL